MNTLLRLMIEFAKTGLGLACVIDRFVKDELESGTLKQVMLNESVEKREIGFAVLKDYPVSESALKFIDYLGE